MPVETQLDLLFQVLEGGKAVGAGEVIPFPVDAGATALEGITETVELGNGVATEVSQLTAVEGGAATTAGVGVLGVEVGAAGAALAPALGIAAGFGLYALAPDFWTKVADVLMNQGETVNGMVRAFLNSDDRTVGFTENTIEIFKNAFIDAGLYDDIGWSIPTQETAVELEAVSSGGISGIVSADLINEAGRKCVFNRVYVKAVGSSETLLGMSFFEPNTEFQTKITSLSLRMGDYVYTALGVPVDEATTCSYGIGYFNGETSAWSFTITSSTSNTVKLGDDIYNIAVIPQNFSAFPEYSGMQSFDGEVDPRLICDILYMLRVGQANPALQPDADYPEEDEPFPLTYPTWTPFELPDGTKAYPLTLPVIDPNPLQAPAQNPQPLPDNDPALLDWLVDAMNLPQANPEIEPAPLPALDPDLQPTPDPIEEPTKPNTKPDPVDPNPEPTTPFLPIVPQLPDTVPANAMFTVYKPTIAQVDAFGGWLWSNSILEMIKRIWQNPLDGIIAFMKVYVDAPTSGSDTIKVGVLDSEVSSAVVSGQFVTVECGSIDIEEKHFNATDYSPFVALHLYLPFIGIVELDIDEFMGGSIKVTYHVDVYTGTCLAEVKAKRNHDMDDYTIVYTFSGNASQQLPLTSAEFGGALSALVGVVGGGLAIASGGGLGLLAGASGIAHAVTHEMVHLAHSGSLSANAGIMGARTPYLILTRRRGYDANGYNQIYGYPSNKTVFLNNCSGFVRVKDIQLKTGATDLEANEIVSLLKDGVIV